MSDMYNPLFNENDVFTKLCNIYRLKCFIDTADISMINDEDLSYMIIGEKYQVLIIKQINNWRVIVRDILHVYIDMATKNGFRIVPTISTGLLFFTISSNKSSTWLLCMDNKNLTLNKSFTGLNISSQIRKFAICGTTSTR